MSRLSKSPKLKHTRAFYSRRRVILPVAAMLLFSLIGSALIFLSSAAPGGTSYGSYTTAPNPAVISQYCSGGLNIALVADVSGSIRQPAFSQMQTALKDFVSALLPSTHTLFSLTEFDDNATVVQGLTSNVASLDSAVDRLSGGGHTNWLAGLQTGYGTFSGLNSSSPRVIIIATDGNPNLPESESAAMTAAVAQANIIKNAGIHILALGVGSNPTITNLQAITGPKINDGGVNSDVITTDFSTMDDALLSIAQSTCTGGTGTGTGNGGSGSGNNGSGSGNTGTGTGNTGSGSGTTGTGTGSSAGTKTQTSTNPAPSATQSTQPSPTPTVTQNPEQSPAPTATASTEPNPAPAATAQGTQTQPPKTQPSPFYDGKQYAPGSMADNFATVASHRTIKSWWYVLIALFLLLPGGGFLLWRRRHNDASRSEPQSKSSSS